MKRAPGKLHTDSNSGGDMTPSTVADSLCAMIRTILSRLWQGLTSLQRLIANTLLLLIIIALIAGATMLKPTVPEQAVLKLDIRGALSEQVAPPSLASLPFSLPDTSQSAIPDIIQALDRAARDPRIKAVWLDVNRMERTPLGRITPVMAAIDRFRSSGKPVVAYGDSFSQSQYLIATAADTITLHPTGLVAITGPAAMRHYFKSTLDQLSIKIQLFRTGKYKSFADNMTRDTMSDAARASTRQWLTQWWTQIKERLADRRHLPPQRLQQLLDHPQQIVAQSRGNLAAFALHEKIVDRLGDRFAAQQALNQRLETETPLPTIDIDHYLLATAAPQSDKQVHIGIIRASGEIVTGDEQGGIAADRLAKLIDETADNSEIDAVVLRIDSPGGSATAAETIHRALLRLKQHGKPLVVSMGAMAASGGYWIATAADEIWAQPETLTGSIGVFALIPDGSRALQRLGMHLDGVQTTTLTDIRPDRPLDDAQKALLQSGVEFIYDTFLQRVEQGRHLSRSKVEQLAAGRVWSGSDAKKLQLVDHLGGLRQAVAAAAKRAGAAQGEYDTTALGGTDGMWKMIAGQLLGSATTLLPPEARTLLRQWHTIASLRDPRAIYAYAIP